MKQNNKFDIFRQNAYLLILFIVLIAGSAMLQYYGNNQLSSLGSNLLAGFISAAVTVYGIDLLIKCREEKSRLPLIASSYEDVRIMTHWALDLWKTAYKVSVGDSEPNSWRELLSEKYIKKIMIALDIRQPANVLPAVPWSMYFDNEMSKIQQHAEKLLERHGGFLDPDIHRAVYSIVYHSYHQIGTLLALDKTNNTPRPYNLGNYMPIIQEWYFALISLQEWTVGMYSYLERHNISNIHRPYAFSAIEELENPPARLNPDELIAQCQNFKSWQERETSRRENHEDPKTPA